jgi:hypothetical protein
MKSKLLVLGSTLILSALIISGCTPATVQPTEPPTPTPTEAVQAPEGICSARDAVLAYVCEHYREQAPASDLAWTEQCTTPEGLVGASTFQYAAKDWVITISYPVVAPEYVVYHVSLGNQTTGFWWEGEVDAAGQVMEQPAPTEGDFRPLSPALCSDLADAMAQSLGVEVTTAEAPFQDDISGKTGTGCQTMATGTGLDFEDYWSVAEDLKGMLEAQGWQEDIRYMADGPTGTGSGFRKDNGLCLLTLGWEPSEDANCPSDEPIGLCELSPRQKLYSIILNCAQDTFPAGPAGGQPAVAWYGHIVRTSEGGQFEDYLAFAVTRIEVEP